MHARDFKSIFLQDITQLRVPDRIHMRRYLFAIVMLDAQTRSLLARDWFEMRRITVDKPLQALFNIQNIRHAHNQMSARPHQTRELAHRLLRILDVLQAFQTSVVIKRAIIEWQLSIEITVLDIDAIQ